MSNPTGVLFVDPQAKPLSTVGQPQAGAYLLFYLTGTTTPANVYADGLLTTPLSQVPGTTQPSCTADSAGRFNPIYMDPAVIYRVQFYNAGGSKLQDTDPYVPPGVGNQASIGAVLFPRTGAESAASITPSFYWYPPGDVRRYGALGNGSTDDTAALQAAVAVLNATTSGNGIPEMVLTGFHPIATTLTITAAGSAVVGLTSSQSTCGLMQTNNVDTLVLQNVTPANGIRNCALRDFTIMSNTATPTAGRGLVANYCQNLQVSNFQVVSCFQGVNILGGFAQNWVNTLIFGAAGWTTRQIGTYCMRIEIGPANSIPSEITFSNFDWKGVTNVTNGTDFGIQMLSGDGIFFSNGHVGFAYTASISITTTAVPSFVDAIEFTNVYADGSFSGACTGVQIFGTVAGITNVKFNSCVLKNHTQHGANVSGTAASLIRFADTAVEGNGQFGLLFGPQSGISVIGCTLWNNNTANVGASGIVFAGTSVFRVESNLIYGNNFGSTGFNLPVGISVDNVSSGGSIIGNQFANCTTPIACAAGTTTFGLNRLLGAVPSVASAATLPNTYQGFDVVQVSGTTTISAGIAGANIAEAKVILNFTGAITVNTAGNLKLAGGGNQAFTAGSMLTLVNDGTFWREAARAVA